MDAKPKLVKWIVIWSVHWVFYQNNSHAMNKEIFKRKLKRVSKQKKKKSLTTQQEPRFFGLDWFHFTGHVYCTVSVNLDNHVEYFMH